MSHNLTPPQEQVLYGVVYVAAVERRSPSSAVSTADLTRVTGRPGQVVGLIASNLADKGLLDRSAWSEDGDWLGYRLTTAGASTVLDRLPDDGTTLAAETQRRVRAAREDVRGRFA